MASSTSSYLFLSLLLLSLSSITHSSHTSFSKTKPASSPPSSSPLTPKSWLIRYYNRKITTKSLSLPPFFTSKLSPLSPLDFATFSSLSPSQLSSNLSSFCLSAHLACPSSLTSPSLSAHDGPSAFSTYNSSSFTNYAPAGPGFTSSFANYSDSEDVAVDTFRRYSRGGVFNNDSFASYSVNGNLVTANFTSYSTAAAGGTGTFTTYQEDANAPNLKFTNYDTDATGPDRVFTSYADDANDVLENFASYGKRGNGVPTTFTSYSDATVVNSSFSSYGEGGNGAADKFTSYGDHTTVPELSFKSYGESGTGGVDGFSSYRTPSTDGYSTFASYGKNANDEKSSFETYGLSATAGIDNFTNYGEGSFDDVFNFTSYAGDPTNFKSYSNLKKGNEFTFTSYVDNSTVPHFDGAHNVEDEAMKMDMGGGGGNGKGVNRWVEPGKFFRESELKKGTVMPMPDIRDKMPQRSFLPRSIAGKIPFSAGEVKKIFNLIEEGTAMGKAVGDTIAECGRAPSPGETKKCATSAEDMIDFAVSVLGSDVVVRSTQNTNGSGGHIMMGDVTGVNGGKVTKSVSCHQSLFPYLVYYCHSVPKVRVYVADILAVDSKEKINRGVAICHLDTSDWSAGHGAFVALGSAPGKIEVCHWIFEGDMTWAAAD